MSPTVVQIHHLFLDIDTTVELSVRGEESREQWL